MHEFGDGGREYEALPPPAAKRKKISRDAAGPVPNLALPREPQVRRTMSEFRAEALDDFYKPCPNYRLPAELGAFSFDEKGVFRHDRSQLRYYSSPGQTSRLAMDLKVGYDGYVPKEKSGAPDLGPILRWISLNGHCFRPRNEPLSPNNGTTAGGETAVASSAGSSSGERLV